MRILYVTTIAITMGFFPEHFKMLLEEGHTVELACNSENPVPKSVAELGLKVHHIPFSRSPFSKENISAAKQLKKLIKNGKYDIVHTHTPNASVCVRLVCRKLRKKGLKVFYTAHGFHFYKGAPIFNWVIFYPIEWICSWITDVLITINKEDFERAKKKLHAKKVEYVPGVGIDTLKFQFNKEIRDKKRKELGVNEDDVVLLSVGELNKNKNHEVVIRALSKIQNMKIKYYVAGQGILKEYLQNIIDENGLQENIKLLGYRKDIPELCNAADIFVFPSKREGLGLAAIEAMSSGLPLITSHIHGIKDYSKDGVTGFTYDLKEPDTIIKELVRLVDDEGLRTQIGRHNVAVAQSYDKFVIEGYMKEIYG